MLANMLYTDEQHKIMVLQGYKRVFFHSLIDNDQIDLFSIIVTTVEQLDKSSALPFPTHIKQKAKVWDSQSPFHADVTSEQRFTLASVSESWNEENCLKPYTIMKSDKYVRNALHHPISQILCPTQTFVSFTITLTKAIFPDNSHFHLSFGSETLFCKQ